MKKIFFLSVCTVSLLAFSCSSKEEKKQKAEDEGNLLAETQARFIKGIGEGLKGEGKDAAESVSEGAGEVYTGLNTGFDKSLMKVTVKKDPALEPLVNLGRCGKYTNDTTGRTDVVIYTIFKQDYQGKLMVRGYDKENLEVGRVTKKVDYKEDDADYIEFEFDKRTPINLVQYFTIKKK